jgi:hypothetical protein
LPEGFIVLEYQKQAVTAAEKILNAHGGVFLADVVGLGKTFISAMLLQKISGHKLIICPPMLKEYWEETLRDFCVTPCKVCSVGKLDELTENVHSRYKYVLIDESHRFRNEGTQGYEQLKKFVPGKKLFLSPRPHSIIAWGIYWPKSSCFNRGAEARSQEYRTWNHSFDNVRKN